MDNWFCGGTKMISTTYKAQLFENEGNSSIYIDIRKKGFWQINIQSIPQGTMYSERGISPLPKDKEPIRTYDLERPELLELLAWRSSIRQAVIESRKILEEDIVNIEDIIQHGQIGWTKQALRDLNQFNFEYAIYGFQVECDKHFGIK
jgi:hypothetical protein